MTNPEIEQLTQAAIELVAKVNELNKDAGTELVSLTNRTRWNRNMIWALTASFILDIALTITMALGFLQIQHNSDSIAKIQATTQSQVLCPLYQQFINADTPKSRELARVNGQDMKARDEAFRVIHHGYDVLGCKK